MDPPKAPDDNRYQRLSVGCESSRVAWRSGDMRYALTWIEDSYFTDRLDIV